MRLLLISAGSLLGLFLANLLSYRVLKRRIVKRQKWDLNICCGKTDGGGINADIFRHDGVANFVLVDDVCDLPFEDKQFHSVLCSHTIEHVDDPEGFYRELKRVGEEVVIVVPPLWDLSAVFNLLEHRWIFLTLRKEHRELPPYVSLPFSRQIHRMLGQRIHA